MNKEELRKLQLQMPIKKDLANYLNLSMYKLNKLLTLHDLQPEDNRVFSREKHISEEDIRVAMQTMNRSEMAKYFNVSKSCFDTKCKKYGIYFRDESEIDHNKFMKLYNDGLFDGEIAKILNVQSKRIQYYRNKLNLKTNYEKDLSFTDDQFQIFLGGLYGDSHLRIHNDCKNAYFTFRHSLKQEGYCLWKHEKLKNLCFNPCRSSQYDERTDKVYDGITVSSYTNKLFTSYDKLLYKDVEGQRTKYVNEELFSKLNPLGLAILFQDDGSNVRSGYSIALCNFTLEDLEVVKKVFISNFDIEITIWKSKCIYINAANKEKFIRLVAPYMHKDCLHKLWS